MVLYTRLLSFNYLEICISTYNTFFGKIFLSFRPYICYCLKGNFIIFTDLQNVLFYHLYLRRNRMLNTVPTSKCARHNYHLLYNTKTCITMWKLETTAKDNFVYVSLLKQQGNSDFEFISVSFSTVTAGYIRY